MELVVIEKHAYLQLKLQIESLSAQIESVKKKIGPVEMEVVYVCLILFTFMCKFAHKCGNEPFE